MQQPIIIIIADGWNKKCFFDYLNMDLLPEIKEGFLNDSILFENVIAVFPSVSLASHTTILTGTSQNKHNIVCHRWVNNLKQIRNFVGIDTLGINNDISNEISTIFEMGLRKNGFSIQSIISRGAKKIVKYFTFNSTKILDRAAKLILEDPDSVSVIWLPSCDALSHKYGPYSEQVKNEMIKVSKALGKMLNTLKDNGLYENAKILFTSDHGFKQVNKRFSISSVLKKLGYNIKTNSKKYINGINIYTNGDSIALLDFNIDNILIEEIINVANILVNFDAINFAIVKLNPNRFQIISSTGISEFFVKDKCKVEYFIKKGEDPLCLVDKENEGIINYSELTLDSINQKYPDIINQFLESSLPHSDINMIVMSNNNYHFSQAPRVGYRLGFHRGSHGGPSSEEMVFPAIVHSNKLSGVSNEPIRSQNLLKILLNKEQWIQK